MAQTVKRLSTIQDTWVGSLGREDSLEKEKATHSSTVAWKIPWTEKLGAGHCQWGCKESGTTERLHFHWPVILTQGPSWWFMHRSAKVDSSEKDSQVGRTQGLVSLLF